MTRPLDRGRADRGGMGTSAAPDASGDVQRGTLRGIPFRVVRTALLLLLTPLLRLRLEGVRHVPVAGPLVVICNHLHNADPVLVSVAFPRPLHFMAKKETFENPIIAAIIRRVGAFPIDRGKADRAAIRRAGATLALGIPVGIFPEGTRSRLGSLQPALPGAALIALRSGAPVLPVAITGSERLPFNGSGRPPGVGAPGAATRRPGVLIRFGRPFSLPREIDGKRVSTEEATAHMMAEVANLLPPEYRGRYTARSGPTLGIAESPSSRGAPSKGEA